jgi:hypothetical protein
MFQQGLVDRSTRHALLNLAFCSENHLCALFFGYEHDRMLNSEFLKHHLMSVLVAHKVYASLNLVLLIGAI